MFLSNDYCFYLLRMYMHYFQEVSCSVQAVNPIPTNADVMPVAPNQQLITSSVPEAPSLGMFPLNNAHGPQPPSNWPVAQSAPVDPSQSSPAREEGEVPESELDPDTRRRLLILQHGQDTRDPAPPCPAGSPVQTSVLPVQSHGNWSHVEDEMNPRSLNRTSTGFHLESDDINYDKKQPHNPPYFPDEDNLITSDRYNRRIHRYPSQVSGHPPDRLFN